VTSAPPRNAGEPFDRLRSAGKRMTDPLEALALRVAEQVIDIVVDVLDVNEILRQVDVNALLDRVALDPILDRVDVNALLARVDVEALLARVDMDALLARVDINDFVQRLDVDALVEQTDLGAVIARSSGGVATEALDSARSQAVGLDQFIDRWVQRGLRRKTPPPTGPSGLLDQDAEQ
jgi:hypothetical protein